MPNTEIDASQAGPAAHAASETGRPALRRALGLPLLSLYGLGTIVGAGIYVLIGKVAGTVGMQAPLAFLLAAAIAALSGVSYAELSARFPRSAGEAVYVQAAFGRRWLTLLIGWGVVITGTVSAAAIANGFDGYLNVFVDFPRGAVIVIVVLSLGAIAVWGIAESVLVAAIITVVELAGLALVIGMASSSFESLPQRLPEIIDTTRLLTADGATAVVLGAVLAFYAFIGFEDMVNVAEEVTDPVRTLPRGIFIAIIVSTLLYLLVSVVAILSLPPDQLANSAAPLADIVAAHGYDPRLSIAAISLLAVTNGALVQIIMASRVIYGLGETNGAPKILARIHPRYRTPARATALVTAAVCVFALWFPIEPLARATSVLTLCTFIVVNLAVIWLRLTSTPPRDVPQYPLAFPIAGAFTCAGLLLWQLHAWL